MTSLQEFITRVQTKENSKVKLTVIKTEEFGDIEFQRPAESELLRYNNELLNCYDGNFESSEIDVAEINMERVISNASTLIYNCCTFFRAKEIRDLYRDIEFTQIPLIVLGTDEVLRIAHDLNEIFQGKKIKKQIEETVKN